MKTKALQYDDQDKWKAFKIVLLKEIEYFKPDFDESDPVIFDPAFYEEVQFQMIEQTYTKGSMIIE